MVNEYQDLWNSLREHLEREESRDLNINVSRVIMVMNLMEKARLA